MRVGLLFFFGLRSCGSGLVRVVRTVPLDLRANRGVDAIPTRLKCEPLAARQHGALQIVVIAHPSDCRDRAAWRERGVGGAIVSAAGSADAACA